MMMLLSRTAASVYLVETRSVGDVVVVDPSTFFGFSFYAFMRRLALFNLSTICTGRVRLRRETTTLTQNSMAVALLADRRLLAGDQTNQNSNYDRRRCWYLVPLVL